jgi:transposase
MPVAFSIDLRERVIESINNNMHIDEAAKIFKVSRRTIYEWLELYKKTGGLIAIIHYQKGHSHKIKDWNQFKIFVEKNKNCSGTKMAIEWGKVIGISVKKNVIYRGLKKIGYTSKKKHLIIPKQIKKSEKNI